MKWRKLTLTLSEDAFAMDGALPDTYGRKRDELAQLLQSYRDRYATGAGAPDGG